MSRIDQIEFPDPQLDKQLDKLGHKLSKPAIRCQSTFIAQRAGISEQFLYSHLLPQLLQESPPQAVLFPYWRVLRYSPLGKMKVISYMEYADWDGLEQLQGVVQYTIRDQSQCAGFLKHLVGWIEGKSFRCDEIMLIVIDLIECPERELTRAIARILYDSIALHLTLWLHSPVAVTPSYLLDQFTNIIAIQPSVAEKKKLDEVLPLDEEDPEKLRSKAWLYGPCIIGGRAHTWQPEPLEI